MYSGRGNMNAVAYIQLGLAVALLTTGFIEQKISFAIGGGILLLMGSLMTDESS
jgi:hypothetical protein